MQHPVAQIPVQRFFRDHIHPAAQEFLQIGDETAGKPGGAMGTGLNEQVNIAAFGGLPPGRGAEHPDVPDPVTSGDAENFPPFFLQ